MLAEMDEKLFQRWIAFWRAEPFGPVVVNRMLARVAAAASLGGNEAEFLPRAFGQYEDDEG